MKTNLPPFMETLLERRRELYDEIHTIDRIMASILLQARRKRILNARQYKIMKMRFVERSHLEKVAKEFGVTRERIRQQECKALAILKIAEREGRINA